LPPLSAIPKIPQKKSRNAKESKVPKEHKARTQGASYYDGGKNKVHQSPTPECTPLKKSLFPNLEYASYVDAVNPSRCSPD
jgi:hypothetical protein